MRDEFALLVRTPLAILAFAMTMMFIAADSAHANDSSEAAADEDAAGAYCGVYSLYGALRAEGIACDFASLLSPELVSSPLGSTMSSLRSAAERHGAYTKALANMSVSNLEESKCPILLHVATEGHIGTYNHWVLFLGVENQQARIVDAPHQLTLMPFAEVLARWDSTGLLVSRNEISEWQLRLRDWLMAILCGLVSFAVCFTAWNRRPVSNFLLLPLQICLLIVFAAANAFGYHLVTRDGLLNNPVATRSVQYSYFSVSIPAISSEEMEKKIATGAVVVDSRFRSSYERGHIFGAINIPISMLHNERRTLLNHVPSDRPIVVYCQNSKCGYSDFVAASLVTDGYSKVSLYRDGWEKWRSTQQVK